MNDSLINVTSIEIINYKPVNVIDMPYLLTQMNNALMEKFLFIGFAAVLCGAWHMSKYSHKDNVQTAFITGLIDMAAFAAGMAAFGFYAIYRGWM